MTYPKRLLRSFEQLSRLVLSQENVRSTLDLVSRLAVETISGCDVASVSLVRTDGISTVGSSDDVALRLDAIQYESGGGPCLDAIGKVASAVQIDDMSSDTRWPAFAAGATEAGFQSSLALTLRIDAETLGALNLYGRRRQAFVDEDRDFGAIYAAHASVALAHAQSSLSERANGGGIADEVLTQEIIGRAVGILMEAELRSADEALAILESGAEQLHMRLSDRAQSVIEEADRRRAELQLPEGFYERMMGRSETSAVAPPSHRGLIVAMVVTGSLLAVSAFLGYRLNEESKDSSELRTALAAEVTAEEGTAIRLGGSAGGAGSIVPSGDGSLFIAVGLVDTPPQRTYQLWLLNQDELIANPVFEMDDGVALVRLDDSVPSFEKARVTVEPAGGADAPSGNLVLDSK